MSFIDFIKKYSTVITFFPFFNNSLKLNGCVLNCKKALLIQTKINCKGENNVIDINPGSILYKCSIIIRGDNNLIRIGSDSSLKYANINLEDNSNKLLIGSRTFMCGSINLACMESTTISIGDDCLFSAQIEIRTGDSHSILNKDGTRINGSNNISIGNHVWLGQGAFVLKNSEILDNTVVGANSLITKKITESNCIIAGSPARILKKNIQWQKERVPVNLSSEKNDSD